MKTITYSRVSTDIQDVERQIDDIKKYCLNNDLKIVRDFTETETGKMKVRPVLTEGTKNYL